MADLTRLEPVKKNLPGPITNFRTSKNRNRASRSRTEQSFTWGLDPGESSDEIEVVTNWLNTINYDNLKILQWKSIVDQLLSNKQKVKRFWVSTGPRMSKINETLSGWFVTNQQTTFSLILEMGPDPIRAYFWPAVNKWMTYLWPGYFLIWPNEIDLIQREKLKNWDFLGKFSSFNPTRASKNDPTQIQTFLTGIHHYLIGTNFCKLLND